MDNDSRRHISVSSTNNQPLLADTDSDFSRKQQTVRFNFIKCGMLVYISLMLAYTAITLLEKYFEKLPDIQQLTLVEDVVKAVNLPTRSTRSSSNKYVSIALRDEFQRYDYLDWFPNTLALKQEIKPGDKIRLWVDKGQNNWIWQIEINAKIIRTHEEVSAAIMNNRRYDWLFAAIFISLSLFALATQVIAFKKWRKMSY